MKNKKNSKILITTGVVLTSLLLNVASPVLACDDRSAVDKVFDDMRQNERDMVQQGIQYELQQLNLKRYSY